MGRDEDEGILIKLKLEKIKYLKKLKKINLLKKRLYFIFPITKLLKFMKLIFYDLN